MRIDDRLGRRRRRRRRSGRAPGAASCGSTPPPARPARPPTWATRRRSRSPSGETVWATTSGAGEARREGLRPRHRRVLRGHVRPAGRPRRRAVGVGGRRRRGAPLEDRRRDRRDAAHGAGGPRVERHRHQRRLGVGGVMARRDRPAARSRHGRGPCRDPRRRGARPTSRWAPGWSGSAVPEDAPGRRGRGRLRSGDRRARDADLPGDDALPHRRELREHPRRDAGADAPQLRASGPQADARRPAEARGARLARRASGSPSRGRSASPRSSGCGGRGPTRSSSTPIAHTPAAFAAARVPGPQPPATSKTVPAPCAIWPPRDRRALRRVGEVQRVAGQHRHAGRRRLGARPEPDDEVLHRRDGLAADHADDVRARGRDRSRRAASQPAR